MPAHSETHNLTGESSDGVVDDAVVPDAVVPDAVAPDAAVPEAGLVSPEQVMAVLRGLINGEFVIVDAADAASQLLAFEQIRRLADVAVVKLLDEVARSCVFYDHGHASAKVQAAHVAKLCGGEAAGREKTRVMIRTCDDIADAYFAARVGIDQMRLMGRVFANRRTRPAFVDQQGWFIAKATKLSYKKFERAVADWVALNDQDGPEPDDQAHDNRGAAMIQDYFTKTWHDRSNGPALAGAVMRKIFDAYIEAEFAKDWETAKAVWGDDVSVDKLARTDAQRRFDAKYQIYMDAANNPETSTGTRIVHNIVWDQATYLEMVARYGGAAPKPFDIDTYRCSTIDGWRIDPTEAFIDSLTNSVRRVIIDAKSVTIDMSQARFFTGLARVAAQINHDECEWPGCHIPISKCQADHMIAHTRHGPTVQHNHAGLCRRHNRTKETGYTVSRDDHTGQLQITTPNGHQIQ